MEIRTWDFFLAWTKACTEGELSAGCFLFPWMVSVEDCQEEFKIKMFVLLSLGGCAEWRISSDESMSIPLSNRCYPSYLGSINTLPLPVATLVKWSVKKYVKITYLSFLFFPAQQNVRKICRPAGFTFQNLTAEDRTRFGMEEKARSGWRKRCLPRAKVAVDCCIPSPSWSYVAYTDTCLLTICCGP